MNGYKQCRQCPPEFTDVLWPHYRRLDLCIRKQGHKGPHQSQKLEWSENDAASRSRAGASSTPDHEESAA